MGEAQWPNLPDFLPPDPCTASLLAQRSLEVHLLTISNPFPNSLPDLLRCTPAGRRNGRSSLAVSGYRLTKSAIHQPSSIRILSIRRTNNISPDPDT